MNRSKYVQTRQEATHNARKRLKTHQNNSKIEKNNILLKETIFETVFANDINSYGKISWENYFKKKRNIGSIKNKDNYDKCY